MPRWRLAASYLMRSEQRENWEYVLDSSRRARGFALYAAIRSLGRSGVRDSSSAAARSRAGSQTACAKPTGSRCSTTSSSTRCSCDSATTSGRGPSSTRSRPTGPPGWAERRGRARAAMRISVSNWSTTEADADRTVEAILRCAHADASVGLVTPGGDRPPRSSLRRAVPAARRSRARSTHANRSGPMAMAAHSTLMATGARSASPCTDGRRDSQTATPAQPASGMYAAAAPTRPGRRSGTPMSAIGCPCGDADQRGHPADRDRQRRARRAPRPSASSETCACERRRTGDGHDRSSVRLPG